MGTKVKLNDLEIWYEDYGDKNNETVLLIMGANANCKQWDQLFIDRLVEENFHVVRSVSYTHLTLPTKRIV